MSRRPLALWVTLAALVGSAPLVAGQSPGASPAKMAPDSWKPVLGPDGHPDLQGVWLNDSATPLERPKALEGRQFLTEGEVAELRRRADRLFKGMKDNFDGGDAVIIAAIAD